MPDSTGQKGGGRPNPGDSSVEDLNDLHRKCAALRAPFEPDMYLNVAFFNGDQWLFWNKTRLDRPVLESWRVTVVDNRILPAATSRVAKKTKNRPTWSVTPNSYSEDDINNAEIGEKVLEDDYINQNLGVKLAIAQLWAEVTGAGFWKIYWDKTKGNGAGTEYVVGPDSKAYLHPDTNRPIQANSEAAGAVLGVDGFSTQVVNMGDVCVDNVSPLNLFPGPGEVLEDCEIILEENIRSVDWVKKYYNKEVAPDTDFPIGLTEGRMLPLIAGGSTGNVSGFRGVLVRELYAKSGSTYGSKGKLAAWTKTEILETKTLDEASYHGCPYVMFPGIRTPGRFWPTCITTQLRGPQTDLNKSQSQVRENATRLGNPAIAISRQAQVSYTGVPGEKIFYDSTVPDAIPSFVEAPNMPVYVMDDLNRIENSITEISGIHEVSKAQVPAGVTAASAINLLLEADDTRLGPEIYDMEISLGCSGEKILKLRAKFQPDERIIRSAGEDGSWDITKFRSGMLDPIMNVEVQAGSMLPRSTAAKQAAMTEFLGQMLQYGVDIQPRDLRKFLKDYGVGGLDSLFAGMSQDELQIKREHNLMLSGQSLKINDYDDDDIHISGHQEFQKTKRYWTTDPAIQQMIDYHVKLHLARKQAAVDAQVAEQERQAQAAYAMNGSGATTGVTK